MLKGTFTALITPFRRDGSVDAEALARIVADQVAHKVDGLVPVGTTGESPTVSHEENLRVVEMVLKASEGKVPVIAGTGSNSTAEAVEMTKQAKALGCAASLQVAPYYNKPSQEGFYRHYMTIADKSNLPLVVYNIPGRTGSNIELATILRLAAHPHIVAVKEASGNIDQITRLIMEAPEDLAILSGDDAIAFELILLGGHGVISVASNVVPGLVKSMIDSTLEQNVETARTRFFELYPLVRALFVETNPLPVKYAMHIRGFCEEVFRLPLCPMAEEKKKIVRKALRSLNLID